MIIREKLEKLYSKGGFDLRIKAEWNKVNVEADNRTLVDCARGMWLSEGWGERTQRKCEEIM